MQRLWGTTGALILAFLILGSALGATPAPDPPPLAVAPDAQPSQDSTSPPAGPADPQPSQDSASPAAGPAAVATPVQTSPAQNAPSETAAAQNVPTQRAAAQTVPPSPSSAPPPTSPAVVTPEPAHLSPVSTAAGTAGSASAGAAGTRQARGLPLRLPSRLLAGAVAAEGPFDRRRLALAGLALALLAAGGAVALVAVRHELREPA